MVPVEITAQEPQGYLLLTSRDAEMLKLMLQNDFCTSLPNT